MSSRTRNIYQAFILGATGLFFLQKIWSGNLYWYINARFTILVFLAAIGFLILAQVLLTQTLPGRSVAQEEEHHDHAGHEQHAHPQDTSRKTWLTLLIVATPLLLGILIPARPLGASAIANRGISAFAPASVSGGNLAILLDIHPANRTILDWIQLFYSESDTVRYSGDTADVVGFVYHDPRLAPGQFMVGRFTVTCCVADAFAIGMVVVWPAAQELPENTWVRVRGPVESVEIDGQRLPLLRAEVVQPVSEPVQPYLFP
jgi:putative membrane protein